MKKILSLLLACVFLQTQCWALSGGPVYPVDDSNATTTYGGTLISKSGSNSVGVFLVSIKPGELGTGQFSIFIQGEVVTGTMTGVSDRGGKRFSATFEGTTRATGTATNTVTGTTTTGSTQNGTSQITQTVTGPVPIGTSVGGPGIPPLIVDGVDVTGTIDSTITDDVTTQNDSLQTTTNTDTTTTADGFVSGRLTAKASSNSDRLTGKGTLVMSSPTENAKLSFKVLGSKQTVATAAATPAPVPVPVPAVLP